MKLSKKELEMIADCIIYQMTRLGNVSFTTASGYRAAKKELELLEKLNSKICKEIK